MQTQEQNKVNQAIQNYAMQQQYPNQQLSFMSGLLRGLPLQSATTQSYQAAPSAISQLSGLGLTGAAAYGLMKKEGGVIKSYAEGGDVDTSASAAAPASTRPINVPVPEGYTFDAQTGQYQELPSSPFSSIFGDSGSLARIMRQLKGGRMAEGGEVKNFVSGGIAQAITNKVRMNPEGYSKQAIDKSTKNGLVDDLVGLAAIQEKNAGNKARVVAGYCWPWNSKKVSDAFDIEIGGKYRRQWNLGVDGAGWIVAPNSIEQVGCIHTCQGLEVDYIGVIIGPDLVVHDGKVVTNGLARDRHDKSMKGFKKWLKSNPVAAKEAADRIIKNTYRTLMTRGMKGCYVFSADEETRAYFANIFA